MPALRYYAHADVPVGEHVGLPSAELVLVLALDRPLELATPSEGRRRLHASVSGLDDRPATIFTGGSERGVFCSLTPVDARRLLGVPAASLAGRCVDLADLVGARRADRIVDRLAAAPDGAACVDLLAGFLGERGGGRRGAVRPEVAHAHRLVAGSHGRCRVADVAREVGWSSRQLTRAFTAEFGMAPKAFARLARFQAARVRVRRGEPLATVAHACGYADQAHLTREWTLLAGLPPTRRRRHDVFANLQDDAPATAADSST
ncbi:AraC-type DNA-binding protein [Jatrophihabitans endophyticus]|uniref:AraC-type DNA-binding protein n=1 Tax=Jatrophihabitans endophyticus TaxID=1206085 RepID=A0A1M5C575_9ACTN|nr:helix-turn-helix domain-containing protein [Jatrophihabitans endophyticus]SHF49786.1 AraC-type DNA-binding protein [Jatrophihabitans endophyticus]